MLADKLLRVHIAGKIRKHHFSGFIRPFPMPSQGLYRLTYLFNAHLSFILQLILEEFEQRFWALLQLHCYKSLSLL